MSATSIAWTDATWNPTRGCARVSPGCENCYAERVAHRFSGKGQPYEGLTVLGKHGPRWAGRTRFVPGMLDAPLRWRKPKRIFVNSMSDLFHSDVTNEQIAAVFGVMAACPQHTFQVLTKRPERMMEWFEWAACDWDNSASAPPIQVGCGIEAANYCADVDFLGLSDEWPLPNVWLGVSCEDQQRADERIPLLLQTPAAVRFVSTEPLLGPIEFAWKSLGQGSECPDHGRMVRVDEDGCCVTCGTDAMWYGLDWVIVGGESGPGARPCNIAWVRGIVKQCADAGVSCFVKQLGAKPAWSNAFGQFIAGRVGPSYLHLDGLARGPLTDRKGGDMSEWPHDLRVRQFPEVQS